LRRDPAHPAGVCMVWTAALFRGNGSRISPPKEI